MGGMVHSRRRPVAAEQEITAADRGAWRTWLRRNHQHAAAVWLVFGKKGSGIPSVSYGEALAEAICYGWIDGKKRTMDQARYAHRYTPRKEASRWSPRNIEIAQAMIAAGRMRPAGLQAYRRRLLYDAALLKARQAAELELEPEVETALRRHRRAWSNFTALPRGQRKQYVAWLNSARRPETRARRLRQALVLLAANRRLGMK